MRALGIRVDQINVPGGWVAELVPDSARGAGHDGQRTGFVVAILSSSNSECWSESWLRLRACAVSWLLDFLPPLRPAFAFCALLPPLPEPLLFWLWLLLPPLPLWLPPRLEEAARPSSGRSAQSGLNSSASGGARVTGSAGRGLPLDRVR